MDRGYRDRLEGYLASMLLVKKLRDGGILTAEDCERSNAAIARKYGLSSRSLYRRIDWINSRFGGNMSHCEEVS